MAVFRVAILGLVKIRAAIENTLHLFISNGMRVFGPFVKIS